MNFKNTCKRGLAVFLSLIMAVGTLSLPASAGDSPVEGSPAVSDVVDAVIESTGENWSANDSEEADGLNDRVLDLVQPGNTTEEPTADDVTSAATDSSSNVVTDVEKADAAAGDLAEALNRTVTEAVEYQVRTDGDGRVVTGEDGQPVVEAVKAEDGETDQTTDLNTFVEGRAETIQTATDLAAETLAEIQAVVGTDTEEEVILSQEDYASIQEKCGQVEAAYNTASAACAEARAAVDAAQAAYDQAIADARDALEDAEGMTDAEVIEAYNARVTAANDALKNARTGLEQMSEELAKLEDAAKVLAAYNNALEEIREADGTVTPEMLAQILGGVSEDTGDILDALKSDGNNSNDTLVNTAIDYAQKEQSVKEAEETLKNIPTLEDYERNGALSYMKENYPDEMTNISSDEIKTTDDLYSAIDAAVKAVEDDLHNAQVYKNDVIDAIKENLLILKGEKEGNRDKAIEALFVKTGPTGIEKSLVKKLGEFDGINVDAILKAFGYDFSDGEDITVIEDDEIPLAGLISRAQLVSFLYAHEGSPDGADAEGEYVKAFAWAVVCEIVDGEDDPEEIVTVAILRRVMVRYAGYLGVSFDIPIEGEDDLPVMNCGEILTAFYASVE